MASFEEALPGLQAQYPNIMDALAAYNQAQQQAYFAPAASNVSAKPAAAGISSLPAATPLNIAIPTNLPSATPEIGIPTTLPTDVKSLYTQVLGRDPTATSDTAGLQFWEKEIGAGGISPEEYKRFYTEALPELNVRDLYSRVLGRDPLAGQQPDTTGFNYWRGKIGSEGITPEEYKQFFETAIPEMVTSAYRDVLGRTTPETDPGRAYYTEQLRSGKLTPYNLEQALVSGAGGADIFPAISYDVLGSPFTYKALENAQYASALEKQLGLAPGTLTPTVKSADFATKSAKEIRDILQASGANKYQEAALTANKIGKNFYGMTDAQVSQLQSDLIQGKETNPLIKEYYESLLTGKPSAELEQRLIKDAAKNAPTAPFFKDNPRALIINTPIGEMKRGEETAGTYGLDPVTGLPLFHLQAFNEALGDDVFKSGQTAWRNNTKQQWIGADPHSKHAGTLARGVGIFGVQASNSEMSDFDRIEKEIARLGGVKKVADPEGGGVNEYVSIPTEGGERRLVSLETLFDTGGEFGYTGNDRKKLYENTKERLNKIADDYKIDRSNLSTKQLYDKINDQFKDRYLWQGRTKDLDPAAAKTLGLTPEEMKEDTKHATLQLQAVGDKLIPAQVLKTFDFKDPNTTRGFFGDIATGVAQIISIPPIALALAFAGGLPNIIANMAGVEGGAAALASTIGTQLGFEGANAVLVGNMVLSGGTSALMAAPAGGEAALKAGLAGGISSGIAGSEIAQKFFGDMAKTISSDPKTIKALTKLGTEIAAGTAGTAIRGGDVENYIKSRMLSAGIGSLLGMGEKTVGEKFPGIKREDIELIRAIAPIVLSGKASPNDLMRLAQVVSAQRTPTAQG